MGIIYGVSMMVGNDCCGSMNRTEQCVGNLPFGIISENIGCAACKGKLCQVSTGKFFGITPAKRTETRTAKSMFSISNAAMSSLSSVAAQICP